MNNKLFGYKIVEIDEKDFPMSPGDLILEPFIDIVRYKKVVFRCPSCGRLVENDLVSNLQMLSCPFCEGEKTD